MRKKIIIVGFSLIFPLLFLCSCGNKVDSTQVDEQIGSFIKNVGEDSISLDEANNSSFLVQEETEEGEKPEIDVTTMLYEDPHLDPELMLPEEKLPDVPGFSFGIPSMAEMTEFDDSVVDFLGVEWIPTRVESPRQSYGKDCSLYLSSVFLYSEEENIDKTYFNEEYLDLLSETYNLFGEPIYSYNKEIIDLNDIADKGPISLMFKTSDYYLITLIEDVPEDSAIYLNYYFVSTKVPHSENNEYSLIDFIRTHDSDFNIKVYYETSDGNFVL